MANDLFNRLTHKNADRFTATDLSACCRASQIAFASSASFLLPITNAFTNFPGISFTSWPIAVSLRAQYCEPSQASSPIRQGARFAKCSRNTARFTGLFTISPVCASM
ncbi:hypothetical protein WK95_05820 [Burkholderia ubonensis]|nr:hypothetical protein WK95_05820 [Burkholderia ubonensis]